jgi:hypothetical protein
MRPPKNKDTFPVGGEVLSFLNKAKEKTEEAAKKTAEGAKDVGHKTEDAAKKAGNKVTGKEE